MIGVFAEMRRARRSQLIDGITKLRLAVLHGGQERVQHTWLRRDGVVEETLGFLELAFEAAELSVEDIGYRKA